jgi:hypothetical protein
MAVPIVLLFFSYLYGVCALIGLVTRSTVAAVLLTALFWIVVFGAHSVEGALLFFKTGNEMKHEKIVAYLESLRAKQHQAEEQAKAEGREVDPVIIQVNDRAMERREKQLADNESESKWLVRGHAIAFAVKTVLPKTKETTDLLGRYLLTAEERDRFDGGQDDNGNFVLNEDDVRISPKQLGKRLRAEHDSRTLGWVIGTSLVFESAVVGLMLWIFRRRDF